MVNFFTVTSGKLIECQKQEIGKLIGCQCGKQIQCQVVNFFIDIHKSDCNYFVLISWNCKLLVLLMIIAGTRR